MHAGKQAAEAAAAAAAAAQRTSEIAADSRHAGSQKAGDTQVKPGPLCAFLLHVQVHP